MPRIAVAVGVFALIVFSIGFNIARYSVVWEMVGASPHLSLPNQSSQPVAAREPSAALHSETAGKEEGAGYEDPYDYAAQPPEEVEPSSRCSARVDPAEAFTSSASGRQLVPVVPTDAEVRRLPPVDQVAPFTGDRYAPRSLEDPVPIYPRSGT